MIPKKIDIITVKVEITKENIDTYLKAVAKHKAKESEQAEKTEKRLRKNEPER